MSIIKTVALMFPPLKRVYVDLENRRRRVEELEGHIPVLKKQMAQAIKGGKSNNIDSSAVSSDIKYLRSERDKLLEQNDLLTEKYDALYKDYCILSMSNEALLKTNDSLVHGDFLDLDTGKPNATKTPRKKPVVRKKTKTKTSR